MKRTKDYRVLLVAILLVCVIALVIIVGLFLPQREDLIQGEVDMTDYRLSSKVPARVLELKVKEGDIVKKGDTLVVLEAPDIEAKLAQAHAAQEMAQATEEEVDNGARTEQIQSAYEMWQKAKAGVDVAGKTYNRISNLYNQGVVAGQKRDEVKAQYDAMVATEKAAKAQYDMAVNGARREDKKAAKAQVSRAKGAVAEVKSYADETVLTASADGIVTEIFPEVGELVGTGAPIMNVAVNKAAWFTFNVREDYLPDIKIGAIMDVYVPATDEAVPVKITRIKEVGTFAVWKATKALDQFDLKTFEVRAEPCHQIDDLHSGMSAILRQNDHSNK